MKKQINYKELHKSILYLKNKMLKLRKKNKATEQKAVSYYNALVDIDNYFYKKLKGGKNKNDKPI